MFQNEPPAEVLGSDAFCFISVDSVGLPEEASHRPIGTQEQMVVQNVFPVTVLGLNQAGEQFLPSLFLSCFVVLPPTILRLVT